MKVSIITATIGKPTLADCIKSVRAQTYKNIEHIVVMDGHERTGATYSVLHDLEFPQGESRGSIDNEFVCALPYATGINRYNGHRIYGAFNFLVNGDFVMWLDDDNILEPNHVESLVNLVQSKNLDWAYSFRKIVDENNNFICNDDCESLGKWKSVLDDNFVDVNCFFVKRKLAVASSMVWNRQAREPGVMEVDRALSLMLMDQRNNLKFDTTADYTVRYRVGSTGISVQAGFFLEGNKRMLEKHNGELPWKK
jgi:glycosyltransferase involved in cell wall biosynthesis